MSSNASTPYNAFRDAATYARMACLDAIGGGNLTRAQFEILSSPGGCEYEPSDTLFEFKEYSKSECLDQCSSSELCEGISHLPADGKEVGKCTLLKSKPSSTVKTPGSCFRKKPSKVGIFSVGRYGVNPTSSLVRGECPPTDERKLCSTLTKMSVKPGVNSTTMLFDGSGEFYNYKGSQDCMWDLVADDSSPSTLLGAAPRLSLSWDRFEMERWSKDCEYDYVQVWDGPCSERTDANLLYRTCGCGVNDVDTNRPEGASCGTDLSTRMPRVITRGKSMCVKFVTDVDVNLNGIQGAVSVINEVSELKKRCQSHTGCQTCTSDPACGWCHTTSKCDAGNTLGDFSGTTGSSCPADMWSTKDCTCRSGAGDIEWNLRNALPDGSNYLVTDGSDEGTSYNNNMRCGWKLYAPNMESPGEAIVLKFKQFDLESSYACRMDSLVVKWVDHTGKSKVRNLCKGGRYGQIMRSIEITGTHDKSNPITINFNSDANRGGDGFIIEPKVVAQERVLLDTTWSGCTCLPSSTWTYQGVQGTGCQSIPDGRAVCRVKSGSCSHQKRKWPPRGKRLLWSRRKGKCHFPFQFKGQWHNDCINTDNNGEAWCSPFERYPTRPQIQRPMLKIPCPSGKSDFYEETTHLDYCSSWRTDDTGKYYNDYSGSSGVKNPVMEHQYTHENPIEFAMSFVREIGERIEEIIRL